MGSRWLDAVIVLSGTAVAVGWLVGYARWAERVWRERADMRSVTQAQRQRAALRKAVG